MKLSKKKAILSKRNLAITGLALLVITLFGGGVLIGNGTIAINGLSNTAKNPSLDQQKSAKSGNTGNAGVAASGSKTNPDGQTANGTITYQKGDTQPPAANGAKAFITSVSQDSTDVYVGVIVEGVSAGSCKLQLKQNDKIVHSETSVQFVTSYYACGSFRVAKSQLGAGQWTAQVTVTGSDGKQVISDMKTFEVAS